MKNKRLFIIVVITIVILFIAGLVTNYVDSARVTTNHEPRFCIKTVSSDGRKVTYWGLGYKVIRYVGVSSNEPYESNIGSKIGSWFMKYELPQVENIDIEYEGQKITITDTKDIVAIENILVNSRYNNEICDGINTHKITLNNEVYYIKESCKEIQKGSRQSKITDEDLETINNIIFNKMSDEKNTDEYYKSSHKKISITIKENTLTDEGITIFLKNNADERYHYGPEYYLEKYENGTFIIYEPKEVLSWNSVLYSLESGEQGEIVINWTSGYDKLSSGKYRLVKYFCTEQNLILSSNVQEKFYVEFEIK